MANRRKMSTLEQEFLLAWRALNGEAPHCEYQFATDRKWRFDFAWPEHRVAVEMEGGVWTQGRHTRGSGYIADIDKYNFATAAGWRVFRLGTGMVTVDRLELIREAIG